MTTTPQLDENTKALYEIAQALNRLTLLKAIELHAVSVRECGVSISEGREEDAGESSIQKAAYDLMDAGAYSATLVSIADDAGAAILRIAEDTDVDSYSTVEDIKKKFQ